MEGWLALSAMGGETGKEGKAGKRAKGQAGNAGWVAPPLQPWMPVVTGMTVEAHGEGGYSVNELSDIYKNDG